MWRLRIDRSGLPAGASIDWGSAVVWRSADGRPGAYTYHVDGNYWVHLPDRATFCFREDREELLAFPEESVDPSSVEEVYYRTVIPIAVQALGTEVLHASAVLTGHGVIGFPGSSGSGKSTLSYALQQKGYPLWSDDTLAVDLSGPSITSLHLPFRTRLRADVQRHFHISDTECSKRTAPFSDYAQQQMQSVALLVIMQPYPPDKGPDFPEITQLSPVKAFRAIITYAHCFSFADVKRKRTMTGHYLRLVSEIPVHALRFQRGLDKVDLLVDAICGLITQLSVGTSPSSSD